MSNLPVQTAHNPNDKFKVVMAVVAAAAGVVGFYYFSDKSSLMRVGVLVVGVAVALGLAWFSHAGRSFAVFARESARETKKVVWPPRNDTIRSTAVVFGFVLVMALFLWMSDKILEFVLYDLILGWKK